MSAKQILSDKHEYHFGTKGLTIEDVEFIGLTLNRYGAKVSYDADNFRFDSVDELLDYVKLNECKVIHLMGRTSQGDLFVHLLVLGAMSSWSVEKPKTDSPVDWAVSQQLFNDVKDRLRRRQAIIPNIPWAIARNSIVWIPLLLLTIRTIIQTSYLTDARIMQITISVAFIHYSFAWVERRRWNRTAIARPSTVFSRLVAIWPEFLLVILGSILGAAFSLGVTLVTE